MIRLLVAVPGWHCQAKRYKLAINNFLSFRPLLDVINTPSYKLVKLIPPFFYLHYLPMSSL